MQKIPGISKQEQCQYLLLQYLYVVKRQLGINDKRIYEHGVMNVRTFAKLTDALNHFEQCSSTSQPCGAKKGASDTSSYTCSPTSTDWHNSSRRTPD